MNPGSPRIAIVGAGPGGLFLGRLVRRRIPGAQVEIFERNAADAPFGFGVVFGRRALSTLRDADPDVHDALVNAGVRWERMELRHEGRSVSWLGFGMAAVSRRDLLTILQDAAAAEGVGIEFDRDADPWSLEGFDMVVGADGVNSATREGAPDAFGTTDRVGAARYIWLGTRAPFPSMTFTFVRTEHGAFAAHVYPFTAEMCTFLVETDERTWTRAGFADDDGSSLAAGDSDERAIAYLQEVFAAELGDAPLIGNNSRWMRFRTIRNRRWSSGKRVLLGDAAHTAHFSLGSGTRLAMEDALALSSALEGSSSVREAFGRYERVRAPAVHRLQSLAEPSRTWWETFADRLALPPPQLAFNYLTRAGVVGLDDVRAEDPTFAQGVEVDVRARGLVEPTPLGIDAGFPHSAIVDLDDAILRAAPDTSVETIQALERPGCDAVRLIAPHGPDALVSALAVAERVRLTTGLTTIVVAPASEDQARTALHAGRCDRFEMVPVSPWRQRLERGMSGLWVAIRSIDPLAPSLTDDEDWSASEIVAHVAEMLRYWADQAHAVSGRSDDGLPFGRTHEDAERIEAVRRGRDLDVGVAMHDAWKALDEADRTLAAITDVGRSLSGVHARRGPMKVEEIVDVFMVEHLAEHTDQAWSLVRQDREIASPRR